MFPSQAPSESTQVDKGRVYSRPESAGDKTRQQFSEPRRSLSRRGFSVVRFPFPLPGRITCDRWVSVPTTVFSVVRFPVYLRLVPTRPPGRGGRGGRKGRSGRGGVDLGGTPTLDTRSRPVVEEFLTPGTITGSIYRNERWVREGGHVPR